MHVNKLEWKNNLLGMQCKWYIEVYHADEAAYLHVDHDEKWLKMKLKF